jgi:transposase
VGQGMKKSEATYLFGVSISSLKRYASMARSIVN